MSDETKKGDGESTPDLAGQPVTRAREERRARRKLPLAKPEGAAQAAEKTTARGVAFPPPAAVEPVDLSNKKVSRRNALRQMVGLSVGTSLVVIGAPACEATYTNDYTNSYGGGSRYSNDGYTNSYDGYTNRYDGYTNVYTNYYVGYTNNYTNNYNNNYTNNYTNYYVTYTNYYVTYTNVYTNYYVTYTNYYY